MDTGKHAPVESDAGVVAHPDNRCFVRVRTVCWGNDSRGLFETKQVLWMKRASSGYQCLRESVSEVGPIDTMAMIVNLHDCDDGIYEAVTCNHQNDWETGTLDSWEYRLVPVEFHGPSMKQWLLYQHFGEAMPRFRPRSETGGDSGREHLLNVLDGLIRDAEIGYRAKHNVACIGDADIRTDVSIHTLRAASRFLKGNVK